MTSVSSQNLTEIHESEKINIPTLSELNLDFFNLSIECIYDEYPRECIPTKINKSSTQKAKDLLIEHIDMTHYDLNAHMVGFKVTQDKIMPWIRTLMILYYDIYVLYIFVVYF